MWIYGASGHGKVIYDCLLANGEIFNGFIDDDPLKIEFQGKPVQRFEQISENDIIIIGIGDNRARKKIAGRLLSRIGKIAHPSANISIESNVGIGTVVFHQAIIQSGSVIGKHCIINTKASVDHDCRIDNYVHVAPGATICGLVTIGELTWIGAGATVIQGINIGKNVMIGAGSIIIEDVPDNALIVGNPGRIIRYQDEE